MPSILPGQFGALLIGTWINLALYTVEWQQVVYFFTHYRDPTVIRLSVLAALLSDTICTMGSCAAIYLYCIANWGDASYLVNQHWPIPIYVMSSGCTAAIVQAFLVYRIYVLSKNALITAGLTLLCLTSFVASVLTTMTLIKYPSLEDRDTLIVPAGLWFISSAVADIAVAVALVWQLNSMKTTFKTTQSLVSRLIATAVKSGSATASIVTLVLILYLQDNGSQIAVGFAFIMGRIYSLTMMYNLNTRKHGRHTGNTQASSSATEERRAPISLTGIQVQRSVRVDEESIRTVDVQHATMNGEHNISEDESYYGSNKAAPFAPV